MLIFSILSKGNIIQIYFQSFRNSFGIISFLAFKLLNFLFRITFVQTLIDVQIITSPAILFIRPRKDSSFYVFVNKIHF